MTTEQNIKAILECFFSGYKDEIIDAAANRILEIEPVRRGRWVIDDEFIDCSSCRKEKWSRVPYENLVKRFRYCPNCGAKMEVDDGT